MSYNADLFESSIQNILQNEATPNDKIEVRKMEKPGPIGKFVNVIIKKNSLVLQNPTKKANVSANKVSLNNILAGSQSKKYKWIVLPTNNNKKLKEDSSIEKPMKTFASIETQTEVPYPSEIVNTVNVSTQTDVKMEKKVIFNMKENKIVNIMNSSVASDLSNQYVTEIQPRILKNDVNLGVGPQINASNLSYSTDIYFLDTFQPVETEELLFNLDIEKEEKIKKDLARNNFLQKLEQCTMTNEQGNLPIHEAVENNDFLEVQRNCILLRVLAAKDKNCDFDINVKNDNNLNALQLALMNDCDVKMISLLINYGSNLQCVDESGNNILHLAVSYSAEDILCLVLKEAVAQKALLNLIDGINFEGKSPLIIAVENSNVEYIKLLLDYKANPNILNEKSGKTPLFSAVERNHVEMVEMLVFAGADKLIKNFGSISAHDIIFELNVDPLIKKALNYKYPHSNLPEPRKRMSKYRRENENSKARKLSTVSVQVPVKLEDKQVDKNIVSSKA